MNCAECRELLVGYFEGLLEESQERAVEEHLKSCEACRAELKELQTLRQNLVRSARVTAEADLEERVMNRIIQEQSERLRSAQRATAGLRLRRHIMKSSIAKIAVAAAMIAVAVGAWSLWTGTQPTVALADVLARVEQVQAFAYKITMHVKGQTQNSKSLNTHMNGSALIANGYGVRMDMNMTDPNTGMDMEQQMYMLPERKMMMVVMPKMKKYMRMELDDSMFERMRQRNNDPRIMIRQVLNCQYQILGKSVMDGVEVEGFQTTDPTYAGNALGDVDVKIWVDAKTWMPVRMDMKIRVNEQMEMDGVIHDFQWDVPVSAAEFEPNLSQDYSAGPGDGIKLPAMTEETAIEGLRRYAAFTGEYPENLNMMALMQKMKDVTSSQTPEAKKLREAIEQANTDDEKAKVLLEPMMSIQMLGGFHAKLVQENQDPAYYGKVVKPGDETLVLLRWKTAENEYRVIFGNLSAATVDADTLATLEAALPK